MRFVHVIKKEIRNSVSSVNSLPVERQPEKAALLKRLDQNWETHLAGQRGRALLCVKLLWRKLNHGLQARGGSHVEGKMVFFFARGTCFAAVA